MKQLCMLLHEIGHTKWRIKTCDLPLNSIIYFVCALLLNKAQHFHSTFTYIMNRHNAAFKKKNLYIGCVKKKKLFFLQRSVLETGVE